MKQSDVQAMSDLLRELYTHTDAATLPHCIVRLLHRLIPADSAAYNSFNFQSGEIQVVHDHPEGDKHLPALDAHVHEHELLNFVRGHWRLGAVRMSDVISRRDLKNSAIYAEFFHPLRIEQQLGMLVIDRKRGTIAVSLQRGGSDFSKREKDLLTFLQPHLIQAYKNAADITQTRAEYEHSVHALRIAQVGVLRLTAALKIDWLSNHAAKWLAEYFPCDRERVANGELPVRLEDWLRQQTPKRKGIPHPAAWPHWQVETERGVLSFRRLAAPNSGIDLVLSGQCHDASPRELESLGLTRREAEVLHWISQSKSNDVIATILSVSKRTVDKQVENILRKLGVESRVAAALRAERHRRRT